MTQYSGRTSAYRHKSEIWGGTRANPQEDYNLNPDYLTDGKLDWNKVPHDSEPSISQETIFNAQWSDCPIEVEEEVKRLWRDNEYGNDHFYYSWDGHPEEGDCQNYPIIAEYLNSKGIEKCLIHWWW